MGARTGVVEDTVRTKSVWCEWNEEVPRPCGVEVLDVSLREEDWFATRVDRVSVELSIGALCGHSGWSGGGVTVLVIRVDRSRLGELTVRELVSLLLQRQVYPQSGIDCVHPILCPGSEQLGVECVGREVREMPVGCVKPMRLNVEVSQQASLNAWAVCVAYWTRDCPEGVVSVRAMSLRLRSSDVVLSGDDVEE